VLIADMNAAHRFTAPGDDLERLLYGFSLLICLPDSMSTSGSAATGTVLRPDTVRDYAAQAGYTRIGTSAHRARHLALLPPAALIPQPGPGNTKPHQPHRP
jgi:hypothetical protein